tara:strand:- start:7548 stop:9359 length:1812 start_codon:yes stop_codon:yes gene_type:complete
MAQFQNAFQSGQQFYEEDRQRVEANRLASNKNKGIEALGSQFGDAALAPNAFSNIHNTMQGQQRLNSDIAQRVVTNARNVGLDAQAVKENAEDETQRVFDNTITGRGADRADKTLANEEGQQIFDNTVTTGQEGRAERELTNEEVQQVFENEVTTDQEGRAARELGNEEVQQVFDNAITGRKLTNAEEQQVVDNSFEGRRAAREDRQLTNEERQQIIDNFNTDRTQGRADDVLALKAEDQAHTQGIELTEEERDAEDHEVATQTRAARATVAFFKRGIANGVPMADIVKRAGPALEAMGIKPEDHQSLIDQLEKDPTMLDELDAALEQTLKATRTGRGADAASTTNGPPYQVTMANGDVGMMQSFKDGHTEFNPNVTKTKNELAGQRANTADVNAETGQGRLEVQKEKINPNSAAILRSAEVGGEMTAKRVDDELITARENVINYDNATRSLELIDQGIRAGSLATVRQESVRFMADILGYEDAEIADTDEFAARMGLEVAQQIKAFGSGTGLSDADREFAQNIVGGNVKLDPEALRRLVFLRTKVSRRAVENYNRDRDAFVDGVPRLAQSYPNIYLTGEKPTGPAAGGGGRKTYNPATKRLE